MIKKNFFIENTLNTNLRTKKKWTFTFHSNMSRQVKKHFIIRQKIWKKNTQSQMKKNILSKIGHSASTKNIYSWDYFSKFFENLKSEIYFELTRYMFLKWRFTMRFKDATFSWACKDFHWQIWIGTVQFLLILFGLDFTATFYFRQMVLWERFLLIFLR